MPNPRYDFRGPFEGTMNYIRRATVGTRTEAELRECITVAIRTPGAISPLTRIGRMSKSVEVVAVKTKDGMRFEVTLV